ncbi:MAG: ankyrin repeat domain-containing protein [Halobacteriovoraceae bacterium]|jgi:hypothetical protein|nr:ankyrin repeat domain-containing protein [Halobacteriovoraceae bacterium]
MKKLILTFLIGVQAISLAYAETVNDSIYQAYLKALTEYKINAAAYLGPKVEKIATQDLCKILNNRDLMYFPGEKRDFIIDHVKNKLLSVTDKCRNNKGDLVRIYNVLILSGMSVSEVKSRYKLEKFVLSALPSLSEVDMAQRVQDLLSKYSEVNEQASKEIPGLIYSWSEAKIDEFEKLWDLGLQKGMVANYKTLLKKQEPISKVLFLIKKSGDTLSDNLIFNSFIGYSFWTTRGGQQLEYLKEIFKLKPNLVSYQDKDGNTLLHKVNNDLLTALINSNLGFDINIQNHAMETPIMFKIKKYLKGNTESTFESISFLIENSADLEITNKDGNTPLSLATIHAHAYLVRILLLAGANPTKAIQVAEESPTTLMEHALSEAMKHPRPYLTFNGSLQSDYKHDNGDLAFIKHNVALAFIKNFQASRILELSTDSEFIKNLYSNLNRYVSYIFKYSSRYDIDYEFKTEITKHKLNVLKKTWISLETGIDFSDMDAETTREILSLY